MEPDLHTCAEIDAMYERIDRQYHDFWNRVVRQVIEDTTNGERTLTNYAPDD